MGRRKTSTMDGLFRHSANTNNKTFYQYYNRLTEMSVSMFEWKNLPDTVDPRWLELCLFTDGMSVFFKDEVLGFLALRVMIGGHLNVYQIPTTRNAYASSGYHKQLDEKNSVIIFNNFLHTNSMLDVEMFSKRLYNLDRAIDVNANAQKTPILIQCNENQRLTLKNLYMKYEGNEPFIFADESMNADNLKVLTTGAPYVADKLYSLKTQLWNEALTYLGISNVNFSKKERLISDEVTRQNGGTIASRYSRLEMRRKACEEINKMFGLNIECDFRADFRVMDGDEIEDFTNDSVKSQYVSADQIAGGSGT